VIYWTIFTLRMVARVGLAAAVGYSLNRGGRARLKAGIFHQDCT